MHQDQMSPPPQSVMMSSWLLFPAKRWALWFYANCTVHIMCKHPLSSALSCDVLILACQWGSVFSIAGLECPRPGWGPHEQTERTENCVLSYLQRRPLDHPLSLQGHPGPHAEGAGWTAWTLHCRQGEACWLWYHQYSCAIIRFWSVFVYHPLWLAGHEVITGMVCFFYSLWPAEPEPAQPAQSKTGKYVPPSLRDGGTRRGESMQPNRRGGFKSFYLFANLAWVTV